MWWLIYQAAVLCSNWLIWGMLWVWPEIWKSFRHRILNLLLLKWYLGSLLDVRQTCGVWECFSIPSSGGTIFHVCSYAIYFSFNTLCNYVFVCPFIEWMSYRLRLAFVNSTLYICAVCCTNKHFKHFPFTLAHWKLFIKLQFSFSSTPLFPQNHPASDMNVEVF